MMTSEPASVGRASNLRGVAGIDEAGRGPVLGPLVVAGVLVEDAGDLEVLGVRDSKRLSAKRREELQGAIREVADAVQVRVVPPGEVDGAVDGDGLNRFTARAFGELAATLAPRRVVVDACDTDAARFGRRVAGHAGLEGLHVVSEHGADDAHAVVSAASIVAKVTRDAHATRLAEEVGREVGSGYASDPRTQAFLEDWVGEHGELPPGTRRSWATAKRLVPRDHSLLEFGGEA